MGLGLQTEAIVDAADRKETEEQGVIVIDTPARPDYWFGHGYRLYGIPNRSMLSDLRARGSQRFGTTPGIERFTIVWEADGVPSDEDWSLSDPVERSVVFTFRPAVSARSTSAVVPIRSDEQWAAVERLSVAEIATTQADFNRWVVSRHRAAVDAGRAEFYGCAESAELIAFAGAFFGARLGRFATPVTVNRHRRKGLFRICASRCLADAASRANPARARRDVR